MRALVSEAATPERVTRLELGSAVQPASTPAAVAESSPSAPRRDNPAGTVPRSPMGSVGPAGSAASADLRP